MVGRDDAWLRLSEAWARHQTVFVTGVPGVGKTRLVHDFVRSQPGTPLFRQARPGERHVPYASQVEVLRTLVNARGNLPSLLPPWVQHELARLLPEFGAASQEPIQNQTDWLRLHDALGVALQAGSTVLSAVVIDDLHSFDPTSLDVILYLLGKRQAERTCRHIYTYRQGELPPAFESSLQSFVERGQAVILEVEPLGQMHVAEMIDRFLPGKLLKRRTDELPAVAALLHRFTGGNPLFVLETLRALQEQGRLDTLTPERFENRRRALRFPRTASVTTVITSRLSNLSVEALTLARVAAVMDEHFTLHRGAAILGWALPALGTASEELERTHVWSGPKFSHDLLQETVLESIPESTGSLFHAAALEVLKDDAVPAAVLLRHAQRAGKKAETVRYGLRAGLDAYRLRALTLAAAYLEEVRSALKQSAEQGGTALLTDQDRFELYRALHRSYWESGLNLPAREGEVLQELFDWEDQVKDETVRREIQYERADRHVVMTGDGEPMRQLLTTWISDARAHGRARDELHAVRELALLEWSLGQFHAAQSASERALHVAQQVADGQLVGAVTGELAYHTSSSGDWKHAEDLFQVAARDTDQQHAFQHAEITWTRAVNQIHLGRAKEAAGDLRQAVAGWAALEEHVRGLHARVALGAALVEVGNYSEVSALAASCAEESQTTEWLGFATMSTAALLWWHLGRVREARRTLDAAGQCVVRPQGFGPLVRCRSASLRCALAAYGGQWTAAARAAGDAVEARRELGWERFEWSVLLPRWLETEALLRSGNEALAFEDLERLRQAAAGYPRLHLVYLQCLAVTTAWEGRTSDAVLALAEAQELSEALALPGTLWRVRLAGSHSLQNKVSAGETRGRAYEVAARVGPSPSERAQRAAWLRHVKHVDQMVAQMFGLR
ncbi:ATP-binding protein [Deinococcus malanensis]|uniref:ATP-binding protein n=1 Tax=Deinococcus malanensis TaxID=1706855 RepID=UPI0036339E5E